MRTANENVIRALAKVIADARAGQVEVVAIVSVTPSGQPLVTFAGETELLPSANLGLDMLKQHLIGQISGVERQAVTPLVRSASN
jgi:hypothetical protein